MKVLRWLAGVTVSVSLLGAGILPAAAQTIPPSSRPVMKDVQPSHGHRPAPTSTGLSFNTIADQGDEDTLISLDPSLSALCQSFIGSPNPYSRVRPNVDMISNDSVVAAGTQLGCQTAQNETSIAVNPSNPKNLVSGTNDYRLFNTREGRNDGAGFAYTTFDGGKTWTNQALPGLTFQTGAVGALADMDSAGDPAIAYGPDNLVYYANIAFSRLNLGSAITVNVSRNGGRTWGTPSIVQMDGVDSAGNPLPTDYFNDKEWIGVDQHSGTVYVSWTRFGLVDSPIVVSSSRDQGQTWSPFVTVNPGLQSNGITAYSQGSIPQVAPNGDLYIAYESAVCQTLNCNQAGDHDAVVVAKSTNGGSTFTNTEVAPDFDFPYNPDTGRSTLSGENFRINSFPQFAIDPDNGRMLITWADDRNGSYDNLGNSIKTNGDVFLVSSSNGKNWNPIIQLGTSSDEVFPAVAANHGKIAVTFYTRKYDPTGTGLDYASVSGGSLGTISRNQVARISTQTSNPAIQFVSIGFVSGQILQGVFIGDYTAVALGSDGIFHPSWTDFRGNPGVNPPNQDAYTQALPVRSDQ